MVHVICNVSFLGMLSVSYFLVVIFTSLQHCTKLPVGQGKSFWGKFRLFLSQNYVILGSCSFPHNPNFAFVQEEDTQTEVLVILRRWWNLDIRKKIWFAPNGFFCGRQKDGCFGGLTQPKNCSKPSGNWFGREHIWHHGSPVAVGHFPSSMRSLIGQKICPTNDPQAKLALQWFVSHCWGGLAVFTAVEPVICTRCEPLPPDSSLSFTFTNEYVRTRCLYVCLFVQTHTANLPSHLGAILNWAVFHPPLVVVGQWRIQIHSIIQCNSGPFRFPFPQGTQKCIFFRLKREILIQFSEDLILAWPRFVSGLSISVMNKKKLPVKKNCRFCPEIITSTYCLSVKYKFCSFPSKGQTCHSIPASKRAFKTFLKLQNK